MDTLSVAAERFTCRTPDGLTLRGIGWGAGDLDIVFLHGGGLSVETYLPALAPLGGIGRWFGINARGHGGSDVPAEFDVYDRVALDVRAVIEERLRPPVVMVGHSLGAFVSLEMAAEHAELVRGAILMDPLFTFPRAPGWQDRVREMDAELVRKSRLRQNAWDDRAQAEKALRGRGIFAGWRESAFQAYLDTCLRAGTDGRLHLCFPAWMEGLLYMHRPYIDFWGWAERARAPVVMLHGEASDVSVPAALAEVAALLPAARVMAVAGGHAFAQQNPEATAATLADAFAFLAAHV